MVIKSTIFTWHCVTDIIYQYTWYHTVLFDNAW